MASRDFLLSLDFNAVRRAIAEATLALKKASR
jgi:hypothetical protein